MASTPTIYSARHGPSLKEHLEYACQENLDEQITLVASCLDPVVVVVGDLARQRGTTCVDGSVIETAPATHTPSGWQPNTSIAPDYAAWQLRTTHQPIAA